MEVDREETYPESLRSRGTVTAGGVSIRAMVRDKFERWTRMENGAYIGGIPMWLSQGHLGRVVGPLDQMVDTQCLIPDESRKRNTKFTGSVNNCLIWPKSVAYCTYSRNRQSPSCSRAEARCKMQVPNEQRAIRYRCGPRS